jgi:hypothetical protein
MGRAPQKGTTAMTNLDLRPFGFQCNVEVRGAVEESWSGGKRLLFLFGENHRDRDMKRLYVLNACVLIDAGVVGCVGTEEPLEEMNAIGAEAVESRSKQLFEEHTTDDAVIAHLSRNQPYGYGIFGFGNTLKYLRPRVDVRYVEEPTLVEEMRPIADSYKSWELGIAEHPSPDHPNMGDHPHNRKREEAIMANLIRLWDEKSRQAPSAILNTGLDHSLHLCRRAKELGISYIYISIPADPQTL